MKFPIDALNELHEFAFGLLPPGWHHKSPIYFLLFDFKDKQGQTWSVVFQKHGAQSTIETINDLRARVDELESEVNLHKSEIHYLRGRLEDE